MTINRYVDIVERCTLSRVHMVEELRQYMLSLKCTPSVLSLSVGLALVLIKGTSKLLSQSGFVHAAPTAVHDRFNTVKYYEN